MTSAPLELTRNLSVPPDFTIMVLRVPPAFIEKAPLSLPISAISTSVLLIEIALPALVNFKVPVFELNAKLYG